jgi:hypothetical protein
MSPDRECERTWMDGFVRDTFASRQGQANLSDQCCVRACVRAIGSITARNGQQLGNKSIGHHVTSRLERKGPYPTARNARIGGNPPPPPPLHDDGENNRSLGPAWIWFVGFFASSCDLRCLALPCLARQEIRYINACLIRDLERAYLVVRANKFSPTSPGYASKARLARPGQAGKVRLAESQGGGSIPNLSFSGVKKKREICACSLRIFILEQCHCMSKRLRPYSPVHMIYCSLRPRDLVVLDLS